MGDVTSLRWHLARWQLEQADRREDELVALQCARTLRRLEAAERGWPGRGPNAGLGILPRLLGKEEVVWERLRRDFALVGAAVEAHRHLVP